MQSVRSVTSCPLGAGSRQFRHRLSRLSSRRCAPSISTRAAPTDVFVLDLNGVLVNPKDNSSPSGVAETLTYCEFPFYVVSTASAAKSSKILRESVGIDIPEESPRLFADLNPPAEKAAEALREIGSRPMCKGTGARLHFVEDHFETLQEMQRMKGLQDWILHLADWGESSEEQRAQAKALGISTLNLSGFCELLKWGLLMGVDDGCEPTPEEVEAQVYQGPPV